MWDLQFSRTLKILNNFHVATKAIREHNDNPTQQKRESISSLFAAVDVFWHILDTKSETVFGDVMTACSIQHKHISIHSYSRFVPRFGLLVGGSSPPRPGLNPRTVNVGFVMEKFVLLLVSLRGGLLRFVRLVLFYQSPIILWAG